MLSYIQSLIHIYSHWYTYTVTDSVCFMSTCVDGKMSRKEAKWCFLRRKNSSENGNFRKMPSQEVKRWRLKTKWGERWERRKKMERRKWGQEMFHGTIQTTDKSEDLTSLEGTFFFFHSSSFSPSVFRSSLIQWDFFQISSYRSRWFSCWKWWLVTRDKVHETSPSRFVFSPSSFSTLSLSLSLPSVSPMLVVSCHDIRNLRRGRGTGESHVRKVTCSSHILVILCFCYVYHMWDSHHESHHESLTYVEVNELKMSRDDP